MLKDYKKLKPVARKTRTIPYIKARFGLPFFVQRYKKRKGFFVGVLFFCFILYILSLYIWDINIQGGYSYTPESMAKFLRENHIYPGLKKNVINCQEIEELIRGVYPDIGWVSAEMKGTRLIIKITETNMPAPAVINKTPCHIIASKDCIITNMITRTGKPVADIGSVVKKGDILVSGVIDIMGDFDTIINKKPVAADADVIGKTFYDYEDTFPLNYIQKKYTGNLKKGYNLNFLLKKINIYNPSNNYKKYDIMVNDFMVHLNDNFYLPLGYSQIMTREYTEVEKRYTEEEAIKIAKEKLKRYLDKLIEKDVLITENNVKIMIDKNSCKAKGRIIVQESVKEFKSIDDSEWRIIDTDESNGNNN
jgi:similar to stage IV sporulation protein